jgi:hypothetical protein
MRTRRLTSLFLGLCVMACGEDPKPTPAPDVTADTTPPAGFGQHCGKDTACGPGLECQDSEFAPFPWCVRPCPAARVKDHCDPVGGEPQGLCVQMPAGWRGPSAPFCVPECANLAACTARAPGWEVCSKPEYKKKVLYPELPTKVCQAPSAHGQIYVDPVTCEWEAKVTEPSLQSAKNLCKAFCGFKKDCQLKPAEQSDNCCSWACFQWQTPGGNVAAEREAKLKCFVKSYSANTGNPNVCSAWKDDCGELPI